MRRLSLVLGFVGLGLWTIPLALIVVFVSESSAAQNFRLLLEGAVPAFLVPWGMVRLGARAVQVVRWIVEGFRQRP